MLTVEIFRKELQDIRRRTEQLLGDLNGEQLVQRPHPAQWSIAECLLHLNLTAKIVQPRLGAALKRGRENKIVGRGPFEAGLFARMFKFLAEPPPKVRLRAPRKVAPPAVSGDPAAVVADFIRFRGEWERLVEESDGLDLARITIPSLFPRLPRLRVGGAIAWMLAHDRRHLWQAENVKRALRNP